MPLATCVMSAANSDCLKEPSRTSLWGRAISRQGFKLMVYSSKVQSVLLAGMTDLVGGGDDGVPGADQFVVSAGFLGPLLALAQGVQVVGKLADGFAFLRHLGQQLARGGFALIIETANHLVAGFPDGGALVPCGIPIRLVLAPFEQAHLAAAGFHHARFAHTVHAGALGPGEGIRLAKGAGAPAVLIEP